jgi:hypothetical protein
MTIHPRRADDAGMAAHDFIRPVIPALSSAICPVADLIDEALAFYEEWRDASADVEEIYHRWRTAPDAEREPCYGAYVAALDQEEAAAMMYALADTKLRASLRSAASDGLTPSAAAERGARP